MSGVGATPPPTQENLPNRQQVGAPEDDGYFPAEQSGHHDVGAPLTVPVGQAGGETISAGAWATYIMSLPWKVARSGGFIKTEAIKLMKGATAVREPLQRSSTQYTGKRMDERIGSSAANVESAMIQIVGEVSQQECTSCQKRNGPWAQCIRFHDIDRNVSSCGNCQWNGQKNRCEFYQPAIGTQRGQGHRRGRSSTSSVASQSRPALNTQLEELEQALHQLKAHINTHCVQVDSLRNAIQEEALTNVSIPLRHFLPSTTSDEMAAEVDHVLALVERMKL